MSCPLVFIACVEQAEVYRPDFATPFSIGQELLTSLGLWAFCRDVRGSSRVSISQLRSGSPSGEFGVMFSIGNEAHMPDLAAYYPDKQTWKRVSENVWIGWASPVRPEELKRDQCAVGSVEPLTLHDGSLWDIPVLREPVSQGVLVESALHGCQLPAAWSPNVDGQWSRSVLPEYVELWEQSRKYFDTIVSGGGDFNWIELYQYVIQVVSLQYRYCDLLHAAFSDRWITTENIWGIVRASTGWEIVVSHIESQKKRLPVAHQE